MREAIQHQQMLTSAFRLRVDINWQRHTAAKLAHRDMHLQVIERDHEIAAFIELRIIRGAPSIPAPAALYGVVQEVYVSPQMRRTGLATQLLRDAHGWFTAHRIATVRAAIWHDNNSSLNLFQNAGYEIDEWALRHVAPQPEMAPHVKRDDKGRLPHTQ